ncbi:hypothetical protein HDA40_006837 [Hamadaea flava]|nr:hypothetical protein [Hamadaea flava]
MNRLSIRVRLTLLYSAVFFVFGAIVVGVSYALVASLSAVAPPSSTAPAGKAAEGQDVYFMEHPEAFIDYCRQILDTTTDENLRHKCESAFQEGVRAGAVTQRDATLAHLLQYSVITLVVVTLLAALAGWLVAGRCCGRCIRSRRRRRRRRSTTCRPGSGWPGRTTNCGSWPTRSTRCWPGWRRPSSVSGGSSPTPRTNCVRRWR